MQPLLWTCKSTENLSKELNKQGCGITDRTVSRLLGELGYSLQSNRKTLEGSRDPNGNSQFEYINKMVLEFQSTGDPVVSVDTKQTKGGVIMHFWCFFIIRALEQMKPPS